MWAVRVSFAFLLVLTAAFAEQIKIKVVDPESAAVAGAELILLQPGQANAVSITNTAADGTAVLNLPAKADYQLKILAPGFAEQQISIAGESPITIHLQLATSNQTVVVTATRTPVAEQETATSVSSVDQEQIVLMQPFAASDLLRFLPGAIIATAGQRGGIASLFVRGGDSTYNKLIVDGVPMDEPGGTINPGVIPLDETDRLELLRGTQSTLYGSDAMTSVVQVWTRPGSTRTPQLEFGADGGNFLTAHGYGSVSGARGGFDYNLFGDQFNSNGQGVNNYYSNTLEGANVGAALANGMGLRVRARHFDSSSGVPGEWKFNDVPLLPPDQDARAHQNTFLGSAELLIAKQAHWQHRLTGYEFRQTRLNVDTVADRGCDPNTFNFLDCFFDDRAKINRAGFNYQGDYMPVTWAQTTVGYEFEDENGTFPSTFLLTLDANGNPINTTLLTHGLRLNHAVYGQQRLTQGRISVVAGARYVHNDSFGNRVVPRIAGTFDLLRGGEHFSGTRLRASYATGIKEPKFEESFGITGVFPANPNPNLKPEENRAVEAGIEQSFFGPRYALSVLYFRNSFRDQIELKTDPVTFVGTFININRSRAQGAEVEFEARISNRWRANTSYFYTSSRVLEAPLCTSALFCSITGQSLLRRPKHAGNFVISYLSRRWGSDLAGSFVGRRRDSDFLDLGIDHAAGYGRVDIGGWFAVTKRVTAYANVANALNNHYEEVVGYPALGANFRAGLRFRVGGD
ncbi:MAG TPA: TonB-dependent receptor [Terriglobales bacterium]|nr:TonB-dependent receptor [Terriglobales bacterium]